MPRLSAAEIILPNDDALVGEYGTTPRLVSADEFGSYLDVYNVAGEGASFGYPAIQVNPVSVAAPTIDVAVQVSSHLPFTYHAVYLVDLRTGGSFGTGLALSEARSFVAGSFPADVWISHTYRLVGDVDYDQPQTEAALAAGAFAVLADIGGLVGGQRQFLSLLTVSIGDTYLRNHARNDGMGANPPRNHTRTSQQRSLRNHGYR